MAKEQKSFIAGRMNKSVDERLLPEGEYVDGQNIRLGSTELTEIGAVENTKGNVQLTTLQYKGVDLSSDAVCIGAFDDSAEETMYWFVHDPNHSYGGVVDMIVSFNTQTQQLTYHVITTALLNFNPTYLVNGVNKIDDLLFFTDDYNEPRKINVTRGYAQPNPITDVDQIVELDISVIKPQPMNSPELTLQANQANDNFMEDTFLCFAYRYKYKDGEYSATSQFSDPAFVPSDFSLERRSFMNGGMENAINSVVVEFNTGSENVIGIDVLFKEADSSIIYVAKKLDKVTQGYQPNTTQSITFSNGDIYTILSEGEILRLYDNVPRLSKAQTIMGNRIMYGNYLEGYDLKDDDGTDIQLKYIAELESDTVTFYNERVDRLGIVFPVDYTYYGITSAVDNEMLVDLNGIDVDDLINGAELSVSIEYRSGLTFTYPFTGTISQNYYPFIGGSNEVDEPLRGTDTVTFSYRIQGAPTSVDSAFSGTSWDNQVGRNGNYMYSASQWPSGYTLTDNYNATTTVPAPLAGSGASVLSPIRSAWQTSDPNVRGGTDPFELYVLGGFLHVLPNGFQYEDDAGNDNIYMIPELLSVTVAFSSAATKKSLHSNRDYQVGIVYQDAEGRQSTALESLNNSFHIPSYNSETLNKAKITIPYNMKPPYWADRYKFVMKQTETDYDTIFTTTFFEEANSGRAWILLEGENSNKVKEGQELIVKQDSAGTPDVEVKTTVLEVRQFGEEAAGEYLGENAPAGVYMLILPDNFTVDYESVGTVLTSGQLHVGTDLADGEGYPEVLRYPLYSEEFDSTGNLVSRTPWLIPAGTLVKFKIKLNRREYDRQGDDYCGREKCVFEYQTTATQEYANLYEFWMGEGINIDAESNCGPWGFDDDSGANQQVYFTNLFDFNTQGFAFGMCNQAIGTPIHPYSFGYFTSCDHGGQNRYQFTHYSGTFDPAVPSSVNNGKFYFEIKSGTAQCGSAARRLRKDSNVKAEITVFPKNAQLVFETVPTTTTGEVYYENGESFEISGGNHLSGSRTGDVDQDIAGNVDGIVNLGFFNCYSFFNGVESYKIKDSITGKKFYLGNRVTAVSEQDYKEIRRKASITYSGIFNAQNNVNKLNEFNLGLANYKDCEESYGPIQVLHSRRTDILMLQEDRISYVAVGKNLLTDAVGGGIITSVPEVLGTQVARIEEYGISENPESFCNYGKDIYFTDAKRSAVIQLKGGEGVDALSVISDVGMRSWFRDLFQTSFNRQKLGGYDPYMDEYVLSPNTNKLPFEVPVIECGGGDMQFTGLLEPQTFIVEFGNTFGNVTVSGNASVSTTITVQYNGVTLPPVTSDPATGDFTLVFDKDVPSVTQATVTITPNAPATDSVTLVNSIACPIADFIRIIPIVITSVYDAGRTRSQEFEFFDSVNGYQSPLWEDLHLTFSLFNQGYSSPSIVSRFGPQINGHQGTGMIPMDGATVTMRSRGWRPQDNFQYNLSANRMRYWRTSGTYGNNAADIATILTSSIPLTNSGTQPNVFGTFPMPASAPPPAPADQFLYLVWDYREVNEIVLCTSPTISESCCECFSAPNCIPFEGSAISPTGSGSAAACALSPTTNVYHTSTITTSGVTNTIPVVGTTIYGSGGCSTALNRLLFTAGFIHFDDNGTSKWIEIDSDNVVIDSGNC